MCAARQAFLSSWTCPLEGVKAGAVLDLPVEYKYKLEDYTKYSNGKDLMIHDITSSRVFVSKCVSSVRFPERYCDLFVESDRIRIVPQKI